MRASLLYRMRTSFASVKMSRFLPVSFGASFVKMSENVRLLSGMSASS